MYANDQIDISDIFFVVRCLLGQTKEPGGGADKTILQRGYSVPTECTV